MTLALSLDEIVKALDGLDGSKLRAISEQVSAATGGKPFIPTPGPQMQAYFSDADVLLYGGSPGGGKTALECGLALNEHRRSLIVRKSFVDLDGVINTLTNILGNSEGLRQGNRPKYTASDGRIIDFMGMGDNLDGKQGNPHDLICVGKETPVLMGDGKWKPAASVVVGDMVATLEGPRRVLNAFSTPPKPSVVVTANGVSQVQSATHKLLTTSGWVAHDGFCVSLPCETFLPIESAAGQSGLLLLADVGRQTPIGSQEDEKEASHTHSLHGLLYDHPYTMEKRRSVISLHKTPCSVTPIGDVELFDLEVEEVNHFITLGGFVNKNCVDEGAQLPEYQVRMLLGWLRTEVPGQRCRMVIASNPPLDSVGDWLIEYFGPWLNPQHHNPARDGELRYYLPKDDGGYRECSKDDFVTLNGVKVGPQSRTFIASKFTDNPYYDAEAYAKSLSGLPDEVRERLSSGNFLMDRSDDVWQTIPTQWVKEAQERWSSSPPVGVPMCSIGVDIAQGGSDNTVLARRHGGYFADLVVIPGDQTPDGKTAAGIVVSKRRDQATVVVDIGGGWGGDCYAALKENGIDCRSYMGVKPATGKTTDGKLSFTNVRSKAYWKFREALDPSQPGGSQIALPRDSILLADLCAPRYEIIPRGIKLESKEDVIKRLGRSPDRGDAVVMAYTEGLNSSNIQGGWRNHGNNRGPQVILGRQNQRR